MRCAAAHVTACGEQRVWGREWTVGVHCKQSNRCLYCNTTQHSSSRVLLFSASRQLKHYHAPTASHDSDSDSDLTTLLFVFFFFRGGSEVSGMELDAEPDAEAEERESAFFAALL